MAHTGHHDPLVLLALELEEAALKDEYFIKRRLFPAPGRDGGRGRGGDGGRRVSHWGTALAGHAD